MLGDIETKLEEARDKADGYGELYGAKETADDYLKIVYAKLYESVPSGSVAERDAWVRRQDDYQDAVDRKKDAYAAWKEAETFMRLLFAEADVWRTKEANNRMMDKRHQ